MQTIAQMEFAEPSQGDVLFIGVGVDSDNTIVLALSLEQDGDLQVSFRPEQLAKVIAALSEAEDVARQGSEPSLQ